MSWTLKTDRPIYLQIVETIQMQIVSNFYKAGDKLPSVRELATQAGVNPNTMQKAFTELERGGLIVTERTSGRFVTEDITMIKKVQNELAHEQIMFFFQKMKELGYTKEELSTLIQNKLKEDQE